jgi:large repetitive protein
VTIYGSGFTGATRVTFGRVEATSFKVSSPFEIVATPAAYSTAVTCATTIKHESPTTDICQVQVRVSNRRGTSTTGKILPPLEGATPEFDSPLGFPITPAGCHCELTPGTTEFDYLPTPVITSVSTVAANPDSLASEFGGTVITLKGRGFDYLAVDWADFGPPDQASSQDDAVLYETGTEIQIEDLGTATTTINSETGPVSVQTEAALSASKPVIYAGIPKVTGVVTTSGGKTGAADTGGTPVTITGQGFSQAVQPIVFLDNVSGFSVGTQYQYTVASNTKISTETVQQNPGLVDVEVCSVTSCSFNPPADEFSLYPPGNPLVTSVTPSSGPAAGGTKVTITGQNLGCVTAVYFGKVLAATFSNAQALLDCGSTTRVTAKAPAGKAGTKVRVIVHTVESDLTGATPGSTAKFTYKS